MNLYYVKEDFKKWFSCLTYIRSQSSTPHHTASSSIATCMPLCPRASLNSTTPQHKGTQGSFAYITYRLPTLTFTRRPQGEDVRMKEAESEVRITKETENKGANNVECVEGGEGGRVEWLAGYLPSTVHEGSDAVFYRRPRGPCTRSLSRWRIMTLFSCRVNSPSGEDFL